MKIFVSLLCFLMLASFDFPVYTSRNMQEDVLKLFLYGVRSGHYLHGDMIEEYNKSDKKGAISFVLVNHKTNIERYDYLKRRKDFYSNSDSIIIFDNCISTDIQLLNCGTVNCSLLDSTLKCLSISILEPVRDSAYIYVEANVTTNEPTLKDWHLARMLCRFNREGKLLKCFYTEFVL